MIFCHTLIVVFLASVYCAHQQPKKTWWDNQKPLRAFLQRVTSIVEETNPTYSYPWVVPIHLPYPFPIFTVRFPELTSRSMDCWCTGAIDCNCAANAKRGYNECLRISKTDSTALEQCPPVINKNQQRTFSCKINAQTIGDGNATDGHVIDEATDVQKIIDSCPFGSHICQGARRQSMSCWCVENANCLCANASGEQHELFCT